MQCRLEGARRWGSLARLEYLDAKGRRIDRLPLYMSDPHDWWALRKAGLAPAGTVSGRLVAYLLDRDLRAWYDDFDVRQWQPVKPEPARVEPPDPRVMALSVPSMGP